MVHLYWSESESDIAWNGYIGFQVVCLHWEAIISGKDQRNFRFRFRSYINAALHVYNYVIFCLIDLSSKWL